MSCYLRHLGELIAEAGIQITPKNRKQVDTAIHEFLEIDYKDCPATWRKLKSEFLSDPSKRKELVDYLRGSKIE